VSCIQPLPADPAALLLCCIATPSTPSTPSTPHLLPTPPAGKATVDKLADLRNSAAEDNIDLGDLPDQWNRIDKVSATCRYAIAGM
jgi:hypothetical protein